MGGGGKLALPKFCKGRKTMSLLTSQFLAGIPVIKDKITREEQTEVY